MLLKAPHYATITISLDTLKHKQMRPEVRDNQIRYLLDRLLCGLPIDESEFEHYGIKVSVRPAVSPEIAKID